jgi:23S rRNA (adenine2030-N6)-methyltransferase
MKNQALRSNGVAGLWFARYHRAMFSYRHAFHAGNHADVLKHVVLLATLRHLTQKPAALQVIDTHAGAGLYRLDGDYAQTAGESQDGVLKLLGSDIFKPNKPAAGVNTAQAATKIVADCLTDYAALLRSLNPGKANAAIKIYPGSPFIAHAALRADARDKLKLFELHPTDSRALAGNIEQLGAGRMVSVARADGFESLKALLPPPVVGGSRRALVLIDPSYEIKSDYAKVSGCIQDSLKRFATGTYVVWYPVIPRPEAHELPRRLKTLANQAQKPWLQAELSIGASPEKANTELGERKRPGLEASGMFLINPPHTLKAQLAEALPQLLAVLGRGRGKAYTLESGG